MADNVAQSIKDLQKDLAALDKQLLSNNANWDKLGQTIVDSLKRGGLGLDALFSKMKGQKDVLKLRAIIDRDALMEDVKKLQAAVDKGAKSVKVGGVEIIGQKQIEQTLEGYKAQLKLVPKTLAEAYDYAVKIANTLGGKKSTGTPLGNARATEMTKVRTTMEEINKQIDRRTQLEKTLSDLQSRNGKSATFEGQRMSAKQLNDEIGRINQSIERYKRTLASLGGRGRQALGALGGDGSKTAIKDQMAAMRELYNLTRQYRQMQESMRSGKIVNEQDLIDTRNRLREILNQMKQIEKEHPGSRKTAAARLETERLRDRWREVNREIKPAKSSLESLLPTLRRLASAFGVAFSVQGLVQFGKKLAETRGEFELQQVALRSILQNKQLADEIWDKTMQAALQSPFTAMQLTKYTKQLAAYRIETDKLFDTTKRLADVSAGLGVDMQRLILAYGQVKAANYLRASEIRQFTEAGVNMLGELSEYLTDTRGKMISTAQVMDMVQKRMITFGDVEQVFKRLTDQGGIFYNMQYVQSQTVWGQLRKLRDAYDQMLNSIGKGNEGVIKGAVSAINNIVRNWRTWAVVLKSVGWAAAIGFISKYTFAITGLSNASISTLRNIVKLNHGLSKLGKAFAANWPALAAAGVAALVTSIISLHNRMKAANREIDEQNLRLYESRQNFEEMKSKIEENNRVIKEHKSTTETLNKAQKENRSIMQKLQNEYPQLAEQMNIATNGIIEMNGAIDTNIRKLNEQMTIIASMKQKDWFSDDDRKNLNEWEQDLSDIKVRMASVQSEANIQMMLLEQAGVKGGKLYDLYDRVRKIDLSGNILDAVSAFDNLEKEATRSIRNINDELKAAGLSGTEVDRLNLSSQELYPLSVKLGYMPGEREFPHDEPVVKSILKKESALLKSYYENGIKDNADYLKEINEKYNGNITEWVSRNAKKINDGTLEGINKANETIIRALGPQTEEMKTYLNQYFNELWGFIDHKYIEGLRRQLAGKRTEILIKGFSIQLQAEIEKLEQEIQAAEKGVDLFSTSTKESPTEENPEEKQAKIDAAWRRRIQLLEEMRKRYEELSKSAYGYTKSEADVRKAFEDSYNEIFVKNRIGLKSAIPMDKIDFTSMESMYNSFILLLEQTSGVSAAVIEELKKKKDSFQVRIEIDPKIRIREDFGRQMEEAFGNYELTIELQKLNLPKGLASEMWGIEETDLQDLRARLTEMYNGLRDENGQLYTDAFKDYEKFLDKIDDLERKQQRERLKDYAKYLETQYSDRVKIEMEYIQKLSRLEAETAIPEAQKSAIREGLRKEFDEKSRKQDWEDFKGSEFYVEMMEDLEKQGTASLEVMRKKLLEMRANAENLSPRALKEVVNALEKIDEIERKRTQPLKRVRDAQKALEGVNMKEVYEKLAINQEQLALSEEEERSMERAIMLIQKRNELEEQGYTIEEARVRLSQANEARDFAQSALDSFKSDGSKESQDNLAILKQVLSNAKADVEKWQEIVNILSGKAIIDEQAKGNKYTTLDLGELQERRKNIKQSIKDLEGVIGEEEKLAELNKELNDAWDATYEAIKSWALSVQSVFDGVMDNVDYFTDSTYGMVSAWKEFGDTSVSALNDLVSGIQAYRRANAEAEKNNAATGLFTANGLQLALVVLGVLMKIVQAIAKQHDAALDKQIQKQQERIDALKDAYARLERQIERTWDSVSYMQTYEHQVQNIREQISAMEAQMAAERAKKNTDDNAVRQYQRDIQDAYDQLDELEQKSIEVFGGIVDYRSAAEGFVEAWKSAFLETGDGLQGLQDHFDEFLQDWFTKQATMLIARKYLDTMFDQINAAVQKNGNGGVEVMWDEIQGIMDTATAQFPAFSAELEEFFRRFGGFGEGSLSGLAAGIQGMTEEQANILEAYWNSVRMYTASIDMNVSRIAEMLGVGGANTNPLLHQMTLVAANTQATHQLLQSVTRSGHSLGGYGIKVFPN